MIADAVRSATDVIVASNVMTFVVIAAMAIAWTTAGGLLMRSAVPTVSVGQCVSGGAKYCGFRWNPRVNSSSGDDFARASTAVVAGVNAIFGIAATIFLLARGHAPWAAPVTLPAGLIFGSCAVGIAWLALGVRSSTRRKARELLARRGPHLIGASLIGEVVIICATALTAMGMAHTSGVSISPIEAAAAASIARLLTLLPVPPYGLGIADIALVLTLMAVGTPESAAIATALLWRAVMVAVRVASQRSRRLDLSVTSDVIPDSSIGRFIHRFVFRLIALLPMNLASSVRSGAFGMLFSMSDDPWRHDLSPYESRKQEQLLSLVPTCAKTIVEFGCADGHNLQTLALRMPDCTIIGIDISQRAVRAAITRNRDIPNVIVLVADTKSACSTLLIAGFAEIDALILSEVLYYMGSPWNIRQEMTRLEPVLRQAGTLVMLHPTDDAARLHHMASQALGVQHLETTNIDDAYRPYVIERGLKA